MTIPEQSTLELTHYGRKSGKAFRVTIWFTEIDGGLWIGSLDETRNWVRNLRASGRATVDFGGGPREMRAEFLDDDGQRQRYAAAVTAKYPLLSRLIGFFVRGKRRAVFRLQES